MNVSFTVQDYQKVLQGNNLLVFSVFSLQHQIGEANQQRPSAIVYAPNGLALDPIVIQRFA